MEQTNMDEELTQLKRVFRSLAVSSPVQVDLRSLLKDYRNIVGTLVPIQKWGYRDPLTFLKEKCSDCFLFTGLPSNPTLVLIVPDSIKHIDNLVQKQRVTPAVKFKGKRTSVSQSLFNSARQNQIVETFKAVHSNSIVENGSARPGIEHTSAKNPIKCYDNKENSHYNGHVRRAYDNEKSHDTIEQSCTDNSSKEYTNHNKSVDQGVVNREDVVDNGNCSSEAFKNLMRRRIAYTSQQSLNSEISFKQDKDKSGNNDDSGRQTSSDSMKTKSKRFEKLKDEIYKLVSEHPEGVYCAELNKLYWDRYKRDLKFVEVGYSSVLSLVSAMDLKVVRTRDSENWLVLDPKYPAPAPGPASASASASSLGHYSPKRKALSRKADTFDATDALPGIEFIGIIYSVAFLHLVRDRRLVANVLAADLQDNVVEVILVDTSAEEDVCINAELIRSGHAEARTQPALKVSAPHRPLSSAHSSALSKRLQRWKYVQNIQAKTSNGVERDGSEVSSNGPSIASTLLRRKLAQQRLQASKHPREDNEASDQSRVHDKISHSNNKSVIERPPSPSSSVTTSTTLTSGRLARLNVLLRSFKQNDHND